MNAPPEFAMVPLAQKVAERMPVVVDVEDRNRAIFGTWRLAQTVVRSDGIVEARYAPCPGSDCNCGSCRERRGARRVV